MSFKTRRLLTAVLVISLFIQMHVATDGYPSRGSKIAFTSARHGSWDIYVMDDDGRNQKRITVHPETDRYPAWSPDGKKIAFVSNRNGGHIQIWVIDGDGKNPNRLSDGLWDRHPDWSPDGTKIVYDAHLVPEDHHLAPGGIAVMDAEGKNKRLLKKARGLHPTWSPDGDRIAFISGKNPGDDHQIYVIDVDGRNRWRLTNDFAHKRLPSWSPDGKRIAYVGDDVIWVVDSDGKNQRRLTNIVGDEFPTWSPQSDAIAFDSYRRGDGRGIYVVDITTGAVNRMQHDLGFQDQHPDWLYPGELSVSPEGSRITMWWRLKKFASDLR